MQARRYNVTSKFMMLFVGFYVAQIIYFGLMPSILASFGYGETFVGYVMSLMNATGLVVRLIIGYIVDRYSCPKGVVISIFTFFTLAQVLFFYLYTSSLYITLFALSALGLVTVVAGICDTWAVKYREVDPSLDYGKVRSCGSISYAVTGLIAGQLVAMFGNSIAAFLTLVAWLIVVSAAVLIPNPPKVDMTRDRISFRQGIKSCVKNRAYVVMIICVLLCMPADTAANSYFSTVVINKGGTSSDVGIGLFVMAFSEFWVIYFFSKLARRFTAERLLYFGIFGSVIRCLALAAAPNAKWVVILICTQAVSFGLTMPAKVICVNNIVGNKYSATALQLMFVVSGIASMLISTPLGSICENFGVNIFLLVGAAPAVLGAVILMIYTEHRLKAMANEATLPS